MNTFFRNLGVMLFRFKMATLLNLSGLSIAFVAFFLLLMQVGFEYGYDRFHPGVDRLYRLELVGETGGQNVVSRPLVEQFLAHSPQVESAVLIDAFQNRLQYVTVGEEERITYQENCYSVDPSFGEVFRLQMVEGDASALSDPKRVLLPESLARKFFGSQPYVGRALYGEGWNVVVGGVYRDWPDNSILGNAIYRPLPYQKGEWMQNQYECFVRLHEEATAEEVLQHFKPFFQPPEGERGRFVRLTPLPQVYFQQDMAYDTRTTKGNRELLYVLTGLSMLILLIAGINFTNFSNALVPMRIRGINTRKVLGSSNASIRWQLIGEAVALCLFSYLISVYLLFALEKSGVTAWMMGRAGNYLPASLWGIGLVAAVIIGLLAGCWPAFYSTSFQPALVLKGSFGLSPKGRSLRRVLVGVQYISSFMLIIAALFVLLQNRFMLHRPLGFDSSHIVVIDLNQEQQRKSDLLREQLQALPEVQSVALTSSVIGGMNNLSQMGRQHRGQQILYAYMYADPSIVQVLDLPLTEEFYLSEHSSGSQILFNETARKQFDLQAGESITLDWGGMHLTEQIAGFMPDIAYNSCYSGLESWGIYLSDTGQGKPYAMVRVQEGADRSQLIQEMEAALRRVSPDYFPRIRFLSDMQVELYQQEIRLGNQIALFSLISVFITLVGVFGVALFESEYKRKEIGIRKVFGATALELVRMYNGAYIRMMMVCFVLGAPLAWLFIHYWQASFAYKVPLSWWIYLFAFLFVFLLTLLTVSVQNWRAAQENPVRCIRTE